MRDRSLGFSDLFLIITSFEQIMIHPLVLKEDQCTRRVSSTVPTHFNAHLLQED